MKNVNILSVYNYCWLARTNRNWRTMPNGQQLLKFPIIKIYQSSSNRDEKGLYTVYSWLSKIKWTFNPSLMKKMFILMSQKHIELCASWEWVFVYHHFKIDSQIKYTLNHLIWSNPCNAYLKSTTHDISIFDIVFDEVNGWVGACTEKIAL